MIIHEYAFFFFMTKKLCIAMRPLIEPVLMWSHYITTMVRNQGHSDATIVLSLIN